MNLRLFAMKMNNSREDFNNKVEEEKDVNNLKKKLYFCRLKFKD